MRIAITFFLAAGCFCNSMAQENAIKSESGSVTIHTDQEIYPIHPAFWGTNFLYWIDDDAALANGKISEHLKAVNVKVLRYPGGTVADNFHWQTNTLENINMFPYESGAAETDFDEFMQVCQKTGAEPSCVLNTESWAAKGDISGGAHEAANWLRYCKRKGYQVKYWEIGNETYWHPIMSAEEYGDLVNVYADSLKRIDPDIILGVNGHWDVDFVSTKERIKKAAYSQLMQYRNNINSKKDYLLYKDFLKKNTITPVTSGNIKWWETVAKRCGSKIDMIIVHWYFSLNQLPNVTKKLLEVRALFSKMYPDKKYLLNMSEYNVTVRTPESHMHLTEMAGAMLAGKTDLTALWPMRLKYKKPTLLDFDADQTSILYQIHKRLATDLKGTLIQTTSSDEIPAYASHTNSSACLVITGSKINKSTPVSLKIKGGQKFSSCSIWRISGSEFDYKVNDVQKIVKNNSIEIDLQPGEVVVAVFK